MKANATYTVKAWEEAAYLEISPVQKMTRASVVYEFVGDLRGKGSVEYLMFYRHFDQTDQHKARASYVGLIRFDGTLAGKEGGFVLEDKGTFEAGAARSSIRVVEASGTGELAGIQGTGMYLADKDGFRIELDYVFQ